MVIEGIIHTKRQTRGTEITKLVKKRQETNQEKPKPKKQAKHADDTHKITILEPRDTILISFCGPFGCPGAPLGVSGRPRESEADKNLIFSKSGGALWRQGTPKRPPETQTMPNECPNGCHGGLRSDPKVKQNTFLEALILDDPTVFWTYFHDLGDAGAKKKRRKRP